MSKQTQTHCYIYNETVTNYTCCQCSNMNSNISCCDYMKEGYCYGNDMCCNKNCTHIQKSYCYNKCGICSKFDLSVVVRQIIIDCKDNKCYEINEKYKIGQNPVCYYNRNDISCDWNQWFILDWCSD